VAPADRGDDYTIIEISWGIRGQNAADLTLNYRVEV
jgi:hypothetical protein